MRSTEELRKVESILHAAGLTDASQRFPEDVLAAAQVAHRDSRHHAFRI